MRRLFVLLLILLFSFAATQIASAAKDPEYLYLVFDKDGRLALSTLPGIYMALHQSLTKADLVNITSVEDTKKLLDETKFSGAPPLLLGSRIKDFAKKNEIKFLLAQAITGRYDQGATRIWLIEDGKVQIDGEKRSFSSSLKPPVGFVDSLLLTAMLILEPDRGDASAVVEAEKYGTLNSITDAYKRLHSRGVVFCRWHMLESMRGGNSAAALEHASMAVLMDPYWPENYENQGRMLKERGEEEKYIQLLEKGLNRYPENFGLMVLLISELDPEKDSLKIGKLMKKAGQMNPDNAALIELNIRIAQKQGKHNLIPQMINRYYEAEGITSNQRRTFALEIARDLMEKKKYSAASKVFATILKEDPQASIFLEKAACHEAMGDLSGQLEAQLSAFAEIPDEDLMWDIVDGARDLNQPGPALESMQEAMDRMPGDSLPFKAAGLLNILKGDLAHSIKRFDQAMDVADNLSMVAFYRLTAMMALAPPEQVEAAKEQYASEYESPDMAALCSLLVRLKAFDRAQPILMEMTKSDSITFDSLYNLALSSLATGDPKGFKKAFKMGRKIEDKHLGKWGILLAVQYGIKKKDKDLQELLADAKKIEKLRQKSAFAECYCFKIARYQVLPSLPAEQQRVVGAYLDFLRGDFAVGALAHKLTE